MWDGLPYRVAYSNGKDICSRCDIEIATGSLQLAVIEQCLTDDCTEPKWYDLKCFFKIRRPATENLIDGYHNLRYEHQMKIRKQLGHGLSANKQRVKDEFEIKPVQLPINDFYVECARAGKGPCGCCQKIIKSDEICVMKISHETIISEALNSEGSWYNEQSAKWYHVICFEQHRIQFGWLLPGDKLPGFKRLREEAKTELKQRISSIEDDVEPMIKKLKKVDCDADAAYQKQIEKQNREYFDIRDKLIANTSKTERVYILRAHNQFVPENDIEILDHLSDVICFGAIKPCTQCKAGNFVFRNLTYHCTGSMSAWSMCSNKVQCPDRFAVNISDSLKAKIFLDKKLKVRDRIIKGSCELSDDDLILHTKQPLFNMEFCIFGKTTMSHDDIEQKIQQMGGKLMENIHKNVTAVISNADEVAKMCMFMQKARAYGIHVISDRIFESIVDDLRHNKSNDPISLINAHDLSGWGRDLMKRVPQKQITTENRLSSATNSPAMKNLNFKDATIVDPDSGLEKNAHIYWYNSLRHSVVLDLVDITTNKNSYYKMQLLESDTQEKYWLFESKGRIATAIGSNECKPYSSLTKARADFARLFFEKTGNHFGTAIFVKKPGKYNQMPIEFESENALSSSDMAGTPSTLSKPIHKLTKLLFDVDTIKASLLTYDLDTDKMPLRNISTNTIKAAQKLLHEIDVLLTQTNSKSSTEIITKSNEFYMRIPHKFGIRRPPKIDSHKMIRSKLEMLDALIQMETTYKLIRNSKFEQFNQLNADIEVLDKQSAEYDDILKYVRNTQLYNNLTVEQAFKITRHGEATRFRPHEINTNRQLLWHGTPVVNIVNILSKGLKDPYPGSRFAGGIFFADTIAKAIRYCYTNKNISDLDKVGDTVLLFLCEVALNESRYQPSRFHSQDVKLYESIKCPGQNYPRSFHVRADGLKIPNGKLHSSAQSTQMPFNEFIVFDESQVKIRYLVRVKFD